MNKMLFVYNPRLGNGLIRSHVSAVIQIFHANGYEVTVYPTKQEIDVCEIVQRRAGDFDIVVCSGDDGTLNEVATGLMRSKIRRTIGYLPAGGANDFGKRLGIPRQIEKAAEVAVCGHPRLCDIGKFNNDYFVYAAAFGFMSRKSYSMKIESQEFNGEGEFIYGLVSNATLMTGLKGLMGEDIKLNDGFFEVMLVRDPQKPGDWPDVIASLLRQNKASNTVVKFRTRKLTIYSKKPVAWTRDGEKGGLHTKVVMQNLPGAVEIMIGG